MNSIKQLIRSKKIVIFDLDDTVLLTVMNGYKKIELIAKKWRIPSIDFEFYCSIYGKYSFDKCLSLMFPGTDVYSVKNEYKKMAEIVPYEPIVDLKKLVKRFQYLDIKVAVITNSEPYAKVIEKLKYAGVEKEDFLFIYSGEMLKEKKPKKEALEIEELKNIHLTEIVYVGDSITDYQFCQNANIDFIAVNSGLHKWKKKETRYCIENLEELERIFYDQKN